MLAEHQKFLVCPNCKSALDLVVTESEGEIIKNGELHCQSCHTCYPIVRCIPRFVSSENYSENFGFEWSKHARTQYDAYWGANLSEKRFFEETKWNKNLSGELILEVGSGSGRFTEQAASTGAQVISIDYSDAVEANYKSTGDKSNVLIIQADLYQLPLREAYFDKIFCLGVLQHTPDVKKAFFSLPALLKKGGDLVVDVYPRSFWLKQMFKTKYWVRPFTKRMSHPKLYQLISGYINFMWPLSKLIAKLPLGWQINKFILILNYQGLYNLEDEKMKEWAILDTFDMLSPTYDSPQKINTIRQWFQAAAFENVEVHYGYNGIEGRGKKPIS